jgi:peptidoglycan/LPS O-acetylase OafA/YrhL
MKTLPPSQPAACDRNQKYREYGNFFCMLLFAALAASSFVKLEWIDGAAWLAIFAACMLLVGVPACDEKNWKEPRYFASMLLCAVAIGMLLASPTHRELRAARTEKPASITSPGK